MSQRTQTPESRYRSAKRQVAYLFASVAKPEDRIAKIRRNRRSWGNPHLITVLLEESLRQGQINPAQGFHYAELAAEVALIVGLGTEMKMPDLKDLKALVEAHKGNAARLAGEMDQATTHFTKARQLLARRARRGSRTLAQVGSLWGSLLLELVHNEAAATVLKEAASAALRSGDEILQGKVLLQLGAAKYYLGKPEEALSPIRKAWNILRQGQEKRLAATALNNYVVGLCELERFAEADAVLAEGTGLFSGDLPTGMLLRRTWTEGRVHQGLGRFFDAKRCYASAREGFLLDGKAVESIQASLDLAGLYIQHGRLEALSGLAAEISALLNSEQMRPALHEESRLALRRFLEAAVHRRATEDARLLAVAALSQRRPARRR